MEPPWAKKPPLISFIFRKIVALRFELCQLKGNDYASSYEITWGTLDECGQLAFV